MDSGSSDFSDSDAASLAILSAMLQACCVELMADYGVGADPHTCRSSDPLGSSTLGASIGFGGAQLSGCLALMATQSVILATGQALPGTLSLREGALMDWTCELANQLLGRLKNKLRAYDVSLDMELPRLLDGATSGERPHDVGHRFSSAAGTFAGYLDVRLEPGVILSESAAPAEDLANEGEFILF